MRKRKRKKDKYHKKPSWLNSIFSLLFKQCHKNAKTFKMNSNETEFSIVKDNKMNGKSHQNLLCNCAREWWKHTHTHIHRATHNLANETKHLKSPIYHCSAAPRAHCNKIKLQTINFLTSCNYLILEIKSRYELRSNKKNVNQYCFCRTLYNETAIQQCSVHITRNDLCKRSSQSPVYACLA